MTAPYNLKLACVVLVFCTFAAAARAQLIAPECRTPVGLLYSLLRSFSSFSKNDPIVLSTRSKGEIELIKKRAVQKLLPQVGRLMKYVQELKPFEKAATSIPDGVRMLNELSNKDPSGFCKCIKPFINLIGDENLIHMLMKLAEAIAESGPSPQKLTAFATCKKLGLLS